MKDREQEAPLSTMRTIQLANGPTTVILAYGDGMPELVHIGSALPAGELALPRRPLPRGGIDVDPPLGIVAEHATGFEGRPGLLGSRSDGTGWSPLFTLAGAPEVDLTRAGFGLVDGQAGLGLRIEIEVESSGVVIMTAELTNTGDDTYHLLRLAPSVPLPPETAEVLDFTGRWCREFQPERHLLDGLRVVENRQGRTSHEHTPAVFAGTTGFSETTGSVLGVQLAWSGNHELAVERLVDERRHVQIGELLTPGEVQLAPGECYAAPEVHVVWSEAGLGQASSMLHRGLRERMDLRGPRKVLLNTWEAVYFDHDLQTLAELAAVAAEVGVERFVLDDGWFGSRRDDTRGLGDWWVSDEVWPDGLQPLIDVVHSHGMDFGLWVEPEMVNPDSDLYRAHPDWALVTHGYQPVLGRQQLVLDFGRSDVRDHIVDQLDILLRDHDIAYLKWDMNRRMVQGSSAGRPGAHRHTLGLYEVLDRIRASHPEVEIESCSSGGGRVDAGILSRTQRVWTSDCNDALERQLIQRGFSMQFPPEVMGAHLGPEVAHTTGRRQPLGFRLATALFGHLGIEWNLLQADTEARKQIAAAIALHKRLRPLLHHGDVVRVDHIDPGVLVHGVVAPDRSEALFAYVRLAPSRASVPAPMLLTGLDGDTHYRVEVVDEFDSFVDFGRTRPAWMQGTTVSGAELRRIGLQPPLLHPESVLLLQLRQVATRNNN